jgi:DNA modification methylase
LKIKQTKIEDLIPYSSNARTHDDAQVAQIAASISSFGFNNPILTDGKDGIVAGHGRLLAARKLNLKTVPVIELSHLTDNEKKAYILADNRIALSSGWDMELLNLEMGDLKDEGFDLSLIGFDENELANIFVDKTEGLTDPDDVPDVPDEPVTVDGDIWMLGKHRLMCGDSTSIDAVDKLMGGVKANICFTSPPYNAGSMNIKGQSVTGAKYDKFDDNQTSSEFMDFLHSNLSCMTSVCDEVFYNIGLVQNNKRVIFELVAEFGEVFKDVIYWKKNTSAPHIQKGVINNLVEFILCFGDGKRKFVNPQFKQGTYWNVIEGANASGNEYSDIHKATFPVYLPENIINNFTARNAVVVDCFGGTGTTLIAGEMTGRTVYTMELSPAYCDVIVKRWQDFTGEQAKLEKTGAGFSQVHEDAA